MTLLGSLVVSIMTRLHSREISTVGKKVYVLMNPNEWSKIMSNTKGTEINQVKQNGNGYEIFDCPIIITNQIEGYKIVT